MVTLYNKLMKAAQTGSKSISLKNNLKEVKMVPFHKKKTSVNIYGNFSNFFLTYGEAILLNS